jgi:hypothetical protein
VAARIFPRLSRQCVQPKNQQNFAFVISLGIQGKKRRGVEQKRDMLRNTCLYTRSVCQHTAATRSHWRRTQPQPVASEVGMDATELDRRGWQRLSTGLARTVGSFGAPLESKGAEGGGHGRRIAQAPSCRSPCPSQSVTPLASSRCGFSKRTRPSIDHSPSRDSWR